MRLRAPIVRYVEGVLEYTYTDSQSNLPSQNYDQNVVTLKAEFSF
jgi:hypothetical protein